MAKIVIIDKLMDNLETDALRGEVKSLLANCLMVGIFAGLIWLFWRIWRNKKG
jgi:hypothetical protein